MPMSSDKAGHGIPMEQAKNLLRYDELNQPRPPWPSDAGYSAILYAINSGTRTLYIDEKRYSIRECRHKKGCYFVQADKGLTPCGHFERESVEKKINEIKLERQGN